MTDHFHIVDGVLKSYTGRETCTTVPEGVHTIGEGAFKGCVSLEKIILPPGLMRIGSGAFKGCRKLQEISVPESVSDIGSYAFHRCHALEAISLPLLVKELGDCVFLYCDSLTEVHIPGVERLGKQVFVNDVLLKKLELSPKLQEDCICDVFTGCIRITDFSFPDGRQFVIPNAVEAVAGETEYPSLIRTVAVDILRMMELDGRCLVKFLTNLKHVEIPEGIEKIGKSGFFDKRGIISVSLPASLKEIESRAFRNCISLETVAFQESRIAIHEDAFKNCSSLKGVFTSDNTFYKIEGIAGFSGGEAPPLVRTVQKQVLGNFRLSGSVLLKYLGSESRVVVPRGVTMIAEEAFAGKETVDRVILPDSLEEIGSGAFRDCLLLQTIEFPVNLKRIGRGAFENCVKLIRVHLPEQLVRVEDKVFKHCHVLKEVVFGEKVRSIGEQAFYGCLSLKEVLFPGSLRFIGEMAFYRCRALNGIHLLPGIEHIGNLAFAQSGVKKVRTGDSGKRFGRDLFSCCLWLKSVILESGARHIPDRFAYGCTSLKQVVLPDTLESVGKNVWEKTPFLEEQVTEHRSGAVFWDGRDLEGEVYLPEQTQIVAGGAFYGNTKITAVHFPDRVTWIGPAALKGCVSLRHVVWPGAVATAEAEVFSGCVNLEAVECRGTFSEVNPETVEYQETFSSVNPETVEYRGSSNSVNPETVEYRGSSNSVNPETVEYRGSSSSVNPKTAKYRETSGLTPVLWQQIGERAFFDCRKISRISIKNAEYIGKEAFCGCVSFTSGEAASLKQVGENAFEETAAIGKEFSLSVIGNMIVSGHRCRGEVRVPKGITGIAPFAFSGNREITGVFLPESLRMIGDGAFWGCGGLTEICFPSSDCVIGARAFEKCTGLTEICLHAETVGKAAFACCLSLEKAELNGVDILEERLFEGCSGLEQCICGQASVIGRYCFSGCGRLNVFDFRRTEKIGDYAFQNCDGLRKVTLNDFTVLLPHAFEDCGRLETVELTGNCGRIRMYEYAFSGCTFLDQVICGGQIWKLHTYRDILSEDLPEMARLIFHSAFSCFEVEKEENLCGYRGLGRIVRIPEGIRRIEAEVFRDILMLEEITIPETVEYIGARAFHGTAWMERARRISPMVVVNDMLLDGSGCSGDVAIPEEIRLICGWAFAGGMGIERVRFLSDRVKTEAYAFRNCIYLKELVLADGTPVAIHGISDRERELPPLAKQIVTDILNCFKTDENNVLVECTGNISRLLVADGITAIGDRVFQDGNLLTEIILPPTVISVGKYSFAGCKWLKTVRGGFGIKTIGDRAFTGCGALEKIELSEGLSRIGIRAFENCTLLREILLPEGLEEIPDRCFFRCHSLRKVSLPSTLKRIGKEAFAFCRNLRKPLLPEGTFVEEGAFRGIDGGEKCREHARAR